MKQTLAILFLLISASVSAQHAWTLRECIEHAQENNIQVRMQDLNVEIQQTNLKENKAMMLPDLNANASHSYNYGRTIDRFTNQFAADRVQSNNFYVSSQVILFKGFQLQNNVRKTSLDLQASQYDVDKMRDDISMSVATLYLQVLFSMELLEIAENQLAITKQQVSRTRILVDAGTLAKGALLTIQAQEAQESAQVINSRNQLDLAYLDLIQMMELTETEGFAIDVPKVAIDSLGFQLLNPDQIYYFALNNQPDLKAADLRVEGAETSLKLAKGAYSPMLSLSGSWGTGYSGASQQFTGFNLTGFDTIGYTTSLEAVLAPTYTYDYNVIPFWDQIRDNDNKSLGIYLSIPIFNNLQTSAGVERAEISIRNMEYARELKRNELRKKIQQAYADALAALNRYEANLISVKALSEAFAYTQEKFNVGMVNSVEYNDSKNRLMQAESELLQAKYEFVFRNKIIDFYMGRPLSL